MKGFDPATLRTQSRSRMRTALGALAVSAIWLALLFSYSDAVLDRFGVRGFLIAAGLAILTIVLAAMNSILGAPKCPHCRTRLVGPLLPTAIASGKCGSCGKALEG